MLLCIYVSFKHFTVSYTENISSSAILRELSDPWVTLSLTYWPTSGEPQQISTTCPLTAGPLKNPNCSYVLVLFDISYMTSWNLLPEWWKTIWSNLLKKAFMIYSLLALVRIKIDNSLCRRKIYYLRYLFSRTHEQTISLTCSPNQP